MAETETHASAHDVGSSLTRVRPAVLLCVVCAIAIASWLNSSISSFHPLFAPLKLALGLLHLTAIGWACSSLLRLERPTILAPAHDALLGQISCLGYVYARSVVSNLSGLPGISPAEVFIVEALLIMTAVRRSRGWTLRWPTPADRSALPFSFLLLVLWLGWLFAVASQKLDLYYTPSSDPDIHAFYTKLFLEHGRIYYDLLPNSDAWMVYPSGFSTLNFVLGRLSGLHAVQLVNLAAYVQYSLFVGASFSLVATSFARKRVLIPLALLHFGFAYLGFNAVFGEHRAFLEGTPRLAHTAILLFPLLFALQHRAALAERWRLWGFPLVAVLVGTCINPTHAPAALLFGVLALVATRSPNRGERGERGESIRRSWSWLAPVAGAIAMAAIFASSDPFYRGLVLQRATPASERELATDLTGAAFEVDVDLGKLITQATPAAVRSLVTAPDESQPYRHTRGFLLAGIVIAFAIQFARARSQRRPLPVETVQLARFAGAALAAVLIHGIWSEFTPQVARPGVLQTRLLVQYSHALQQQINLMFYSLTPGVLLGLLLGLLDRRSVRLAGHERSVELALGLGLVAVSLPFLYASHQDHRAGFYSELRNSPLGYVYASDIEFATRVRERVGPDERVLLPGRLRRAPGEHWIFSTDAGRAIPLYSNVKTSFFLGLDGWAYTAGAYEAHVQPPNFDPQWLRAENTLWLVDSGNFPRRILATHYEREFGDDHAVLWRLRN